MWQSAMATATITVAKLVELTEGWTVAKLQSLRVYILRSCSLTTDVTVQGAYDETLQVCVRVCVREYE